MIEGMSRVARDIPIEHSFESVGVRADGSMFHFLMTAAKIELDDGPAIVAYIIDISKTREFEEKLIIKDMQARLQSDMVDVVSWEFDGTTGHFIFDDLFFRLYGTSSDKEGGHMFTAEDYIQRFVHPEDAEACSPINAERMQGSQEGRICGNGASYHKKRWRGPLGAGPGRSAP